MTKKINYQKLIICKNCNKKTSKQKGEKNFYQGLYYCSVCDIFYTENGKTI